MKVGDKVVCIRGVFNTKDQYGEEVASGRIPKKDCIYTIIEIDHDKDGLYLVLKEFGLGLSYASVIFAPLESNSNFKSSKDSRRLAREAQEQLIEYIPQEVEVPRKTKVESYYKLNRIVWLTEG